MDDKINDCILNFLAHKESLEDIKKLKEWLEFDPKHREELKQWLKVWDAAGMADDVERYRPNEAYQRFMFRLKRKTQSQSFAKNQNTSLYNTIRRIAVVFAISFLLGIGSHYIWVKNQPVESFFVEHIVPLGSKSEINLPDGSTIWLNAGSKLRYPADYGKATRDIHLVGEGYFKVAKQVNKPFTVHTPLMKVRALGTEFNVKAYPEEAAATTMLIEGEVVIDEGETETDFFSQPIVLKPGQIFSIKTQVEEVLVGEDVKTAQQSVTESEIPPTINMVKQLEPTIVKAEVTWKEKNWRIESEELQNLLIKLERRYDVHIQVDDRLKNYRFSGTLMDESLEQVLYAMQLTAPILFRVDGKNVYIQIDPKKL